MSAPAPLKAEAAARILRSEKSLYSDAVRLAAFRQIERAVNEMRPEFEKIAAQTRRVTDGDA